MGGEAEWAAEIRASLLGRFRAKNRRLGELESAASLDATQDLVRRWWTFEGADYGPLGGALGARWELLRGAVERLLGTFNPELRRGDQPEGPIDWPATLAGGGAWMWPRTYVSYTSKIGLGEAERAALVGWLDWIWREHVAWCAAVGATRPEAPSHARGASGVGREVLARWAAVARRSRWPLLREVVAETLRYKLETELWIAQLPLPAEREALFELLCLVRFIAALGGSPDHVRLLDNRLNRNRLTLGEGDVHQIAYQHSIPEAEMLRGPLFDGGLREAMHHFGLRKPRRMDLLFDLGPNPHGLDAIIVEAKSGTQDPAGAIWQLRAYRDALAARGYKRCIVWIISERATFSQYDLAWVERQLESPQDVWLVSGQDAIGDVSRLLVQAPPR